MKILVTGSSGVIGRELLKLLHEKYDVLAVDRVNPAEKLDGITYKNINIGTDNIDPVKEFNPDIVIHLAASFERLAESPEHFDKNWHDNVLSFREVIDNTNPSKFIFPSSYLIYKDFTKRIEITDDILPRNLTACSKYYIERELQFIRSHNLKNMDVCIIRIFRGYGCGSRDVISRFVRSFLKDEKIEVYNENNSFDFIYSKDTAAELLSMTNHNIKGFNIYNTGTGKPTSINTIYKYLLKRFDKKEKSFIIHRTSTETPFESSCAGDKGRTLLRLTKYTIEQGIDEIIEYEKGLIKDEHPNNISESQGMVSESIPEST